MVVSTYRLSPCSRRRFSRVFYDSGRPARGVGRLFQSREQVLTKNADPWTARKSPFPPVLKADVRAAGRVCFENEMLSERDDERRQGLFTALCSCLPYNATTLRVSLLHGSWLCMMLTLDRNSSIDYVSRIIGTFFSIVKIPVSSA